MAAAYPSLSSSLLNAAGVHVAGFVPRGSGPNCFNEKEVFGRSVSKEMALVSQFAAFASDIALSNAGLTSSNQTLKSNACGVEIPINMDRVGVSIGSGGIGSLVDINETQKALNVSYKKVSPYFVPKILVNMPAAQVSMRHGLRGPVHAVATACAAGSHSIGDAFNFIRLGYADMMLAGGSEACIDDLAIAGFARMKALSGSKDPAKASSPFNSTRDGFVISEGAGVLVLEDLDHAISRKARIIAEIIGYGLSGDAFHLTSPPPVSTQTSPSILSPSSSSSSSLSSSSSSLGGAQRAMMQVLDMAGVLANEVDYVNCHSTSTPVGDGIESDTIDWIFADNNVNGNSDINIGGGNSITKRPSDRPLYISSTKGATGHLLGAAGAVETIFTCLAIRDNVVPPTRNLDSPKPIPQSFLHASEKVSFDSNNNKRQLKIAVKNSFGFGGTNAVLCLKRYED
jgi:3-oxoacyl-[acyl-carrier-protein] synthase II